MGDSLSSVSGGGGQAGDSYSYCPDYLQDYKIVTPIFSDITPVYNEVIQRLNCKIDQYVSAPQPVVAPPQNETEEKTLTKTLLEIGLSVAIGLITSSSAKRMIKAIVAEGATASQIASGFLTLGKRTAEITAGIPAGSAAFFSGVMSMLQGTGLGVLGGLADNAIGEEEGFWENMADYAYLGLTASLVPITGSLWGILRAERIAVEVVEKASWGKNLFDGFFSGGVSDALGSFRDQWKEKEFGNINWSEVALSGATGASVGGAFGCAMPFLFDGAGWAARKFFTPAPPRLPSPIRVRRETEDLFNQLHDLVQAENVEILPFPARQQAQVLLDQASHLNEEALEAAGFTRSLLSEIRVALSEKDMVGLRALVTSNRLRAAKEAMATYVPDPVRRRALPGGIYSNQAEGVRPIPRALREDPTFIALHEGDFDKTLGVRRRIEVIEYLLDINLTQGGKLRSDLDDEALKKLLRFLGVKCDSKESWDEHLRWARALCDQWKMDWDDTVVDQVRPGGFDSLLYLQGWMKVFGSPLQLLPGFNGGVSMLAQARPIPQLLMAALRNGAVPTETDGIPEILIWLAQILQTHKLAFFEKLPYQNLSYKEVLESRFCKTADQHLEALRRLLGELRNGWDHLSEDLKDTVAILVNDKRGYKLKFPTLYQLLGELSKKFGISFDNAPYYVKYIALLGEKLGVKAVQVVNRGMSALGGNFLTADTLGAPNLLFRTTSLRDFKIFTRPLDILERATNYFGGTNSLPSEKYSLDYMLDAAQSMVDEKGLRLVRFESPKPEDVVDQLLEAVYRPKPHNGMAPGGNVERGYISVTLKALFKDLVARVKESKQVIREMKGFLAIDIDESGRSGLDKALKRWEEIQRRSLAAAPRKEAVYPDLSRAQINPLSPDDLEPLWIRLRRHARYIWTGEWQSPNSSTSPT